MESKSENKKYRFIDSEVLIVRQTILEEIESLKIGAIKRIMTMVDSHVTDRNSHSHIRKSVLDSLNDTCRTFEITLDKVISKYKHTIDVKDERIQELQKPRESHKNEQSEDGEIG